MNKPYFVVDIETCPIDMEKYLALDEENRTDLLNPIDSKIIAIGVRYNNENKIFYGNEKEILQQFWAEWDAVTQKAPSTSLVGFGIIPFDMPFLTSRSFIHGVQIKPFTVKYVIDLRDKINAYRYGPTRGKLKEYAKLLGLEVLDVDGSDVAALYKNNETEKIKEYLANDLIITDELYKRAVETKIIDISRW